MKILEHSRHPGSVSWSAKEKGTVFLLLSFQKGTNLHITHHAGLSKIRSGSVFHKALFPTSPKGTLNLLKHFLDSQISFKFNRVFSGEKNFSPPEAVMI